MDEGPLKQTVLDTGIPIRRNWRLNPTEFAFLWDECPRCFYLKHCRGFPRPSPPFPRVFGQIDGLMKNAFAGQRFEEIFSNAPPGEFVRSSGRVESRPIDLPGCASTFSVHGTYDALVKLDDGGYCAIEFKTSSGGDKIAFRFSRQLHAYAWALERAAPRGDHATPVSALALILFKPSQFELQAKRAEFKGELQYVPIQRDDQSFERILRRILGILDSSDAPPPDPDCAWCAYRAVGAELHR